MEEEKPVLYPFLDWYAIWPGQAGVPDNLESWLEDPPVGVQLTIQPARKSKVFFRAEKPWEQMFMPFITMLYENGIYRLWYGATPDFKDQYVCYAESKDGFKWERPQLGLYDYQDSTDNNILAHTKDIPLQSVFIDPTAPPEQRYKGIGAQTRYYRKGVRDPEMDMSKYRELRKALEQGEAYTPEQLDKEVEMRELVMGAFSADGLRWQLIEEPLIDVKRTGLDTHNIGAYEVETQEYVAYLRGWLDRRRLVRRTSGKEFGNWPHPRYVFMCDPQDPMSDDVYNPCYCQYPSNNSFRLLFPSMYHRLGSELDIQLASSHDGWNWGRPERKPIITRDFEGGEYSQIYASPNIVPMGGDWETATEWGLPFTGIFARHDWSGPFSHEASPKTEFRWAIWKRDRLVALEAPTEGKATLVARPCHGKDLRINFQTRKAGWVKVGLVNSPITPPTPVKPIEGYELENSDTLIGDELSKVVTWKGKSDLSELKGKRVSIRLQMARAKVFSVSI